MLSYFFFFFSFQEKLAEIATFGIIKLQMRNHKKKQINNFDAKGS